MKRTFKFIADFEGEIPGHGTKDLEKVVGLQTDKPLKRAFMPYGGIKMAKRILYFSVKILI